MISPACVNYSIIARLTCLLLLIGLPRAPLCYNYTLEFILIVMSNVEMRLKCARVNRTSTVLLLSHKNLVHNIVGAYLFVTYIRSSRALVSNNYYNVVYQLLFIVVKLFRTRR
jgi:hypothetical protein